jgi:hypothetical protein
MVAEHGTTPALPGLITVMWFDEIDYSVRVCALLLWIQAIRSNKIASEKILKIRFISLPIPMADQAPKKTKTTAAITTVAQKTPMPAIIKS